MYLNLLQKYCHECCAFSAVQKGQSHKMDRRVLVPTYCSVGTIPIYPVSCNCLNRFLLVVRPGANHRGARGGRDPEDSHLGGEGQAQPDLPAQVGVGDLPVPTQVGVGDLSAQVRVRDLPVPTQVGVPR